MNICIIVFPGSNRERDAAAAVERFAGVKPIFVWHQETELPSADLIILPGGFAHGDYLRTGAIAARAPIMSAVIAAATRGVKILGICNGFQILTEAGLLPGILLRNTALRFLCRDVYLRVATRNSPFTRHYNAGDIIKTPIAHHDGNYFADAATLDRLEDQDRIVFRYVGSDGEEANAGNPNGSIRNIAGILNERRNILGLMPHLENAIDPLLGSVDGSGLFQSLLQAA